MITDTEALVEGIDNWINSGQAPDSVLSEARQRLARLRPRLIEIAQDPAFAGWQPVVLPTGAMEDTLLAGDHMLVSVVRPGTALVRHGDIVVFEYPVDASQSFVKRVIGVPGDRIRFINKRLWRNGEPVEEPYAVHKTTYLDRYRDNFPSTPNSSVFAPAKDMIEKHVEGGEVIVPPDHYFVMGDNRDKSLDSRYWGLLPASRIIGQPVALYWSEEQQSSSEEKQIRWQRVGLSLLR